jgi:hypothetical protein
MNCKGKRNPDRNELWNNNTCGKVDVLLANEFKRPIGLMPEIFMTTSNLKTWLKEAEH